MCFRNVGGRLWLLRWTGSRPPRLAGPFTFASALLEHYFRGHANRIRRRRIARCRLPFGESGVWPLCVLSGRRGQEFIPFIPTKKMPGTARSFSFRTWYPRILSPKPKSCRPEGKERARPARQGAAFGCLFLLCLLTSGTVSEAMQAGGKRAAKGR